MAAAPYEVLEDLPGYWRETEARFALEKWRASGLTLAAFARRHGIHVAKLRRWQGRLGADPVRFVQLTVTRAPATESPVEPFRLRMGDLVVEVPPGFCGDDLARLLGVLGC
jgi:transposase